MPPRQFGWYGGRSCDSAGELREKVLYLLNHPKEASRMAVTPEFGVQQIQDFLAQLRRLSATTPPYHPELARWHASEFATGIPVAMALKQREVISVFIGINRSIEIYR